MKICGTVPIHIAKYFILYPGINYSSSEKFQKLKKFFKKRKNTKNAVALGIKGSTVLSELITIRRKHDRIKSKPFRKLAKFSRVKTLTRVLKVC